MVIIKKSVIADDQQVIIPKYNEAAKQEFNSNTSTAAETVIWHAMNNADKNLTQAQRSWLKSVPTKQSAVFCKGPLDLEMTNFIYHKIDT